MSKPNLSLKELRRLLKIFNAGQLCRADHPDDDTYDSVRFEDAVKKAFSRDQWVDAKKKAPKFSDEYIVVWDLKDGGKPLSTTMDYDAIEDKWSDPRGVPDKKMNTVVLFWRKMPNPPPIKKK